MLILQGPTCMKAYTTLVSCQVYKGDSKDNLAIEMANCYEQFSNGSNHIEIKKKKIIEKCKLSNCISLQFL